MQGDLAQKYEALKDAIRPLGRAMVAFSGGVDSSLVTYVAGQVLGENALAVTSSTASLKRRDLQLAIRLAEEWGVAHRVISTDEITKEDYRKNPVNRCFHCKTSLYSEMRHVAEEAGFTIILNGTNCDDLGDHRPGLVAADDFDVRSPLVEAGFSKADIRALAHALGMENADKPQAACLSSRFPYGTAITEALLAQVEQAEDVLADAGFTQFRVRHHGDVARLELMPDEFGVLLENRSRIEAAIKAAGYRYVSLDLGGFRSGSLNDALDPEQIQVVQIVAAPGTSQ